MIYTVTFNPSLDYRVECDDFSPNKTNRGRSDSIMLGGKGVNVSKALTSLGVRNIPIMFVGMGDIGAVIEKRAYEELKNPIIVKTPCDNRINTKVIDSFGRVTEINGKGSLDISDSSLKEAIALMRIEDGDVIVISGNTVREGILTQFSQLLFSTFGNGIKLVIDVATRELKNVIERYGDNILLIKPNHDEFDTVFGECKDIIFALKNIKVNAATVTDGANIVYYRGGNGDVYAVIPPKADCVVDTVGAGDSFIAGYLYSIESGRSEIEAIKIAVAVSAYKVNKYGFSDLKDSLVSAFDVDARRVDTELK